jgi:hypothetical protein
MLIPLNHNFLRLGWMKCSMTINFDSILKKHKDLSDFAAAISYNLNLMI